MLFEVIAAGQKLVERFGGTDDGARVVGKEVEEAVFAGKEFAEPGQHHKYVRSWIVMRLSYCTQVIKKSAEL
ncbi:hypothetical protein D3C86_2081670 [compost metagenome]